MNSLRKKIQYTLLTTVILVATAFTTDPGILQSILEKINRYHTANPQQKLYIQHDKPFYVAGDSIWFKAYLVEAALHNVDSLSRVVYVELLNSQNSIIQRRMLYTNGVSFGDFALPDTLREGKYLLRAYTNYMRNAGEDFFFNKEISVLNPATTNTQAAQSPMINPDSTDLQFFPEGGDLVASGKLSRIAFKAVGQDGKSIAIEGEIIDENQSVVTTFKTEHEGMGLVWLNAEAGKLYQARITKPYPVSRLYSFPQVRKTGYTLQINQVGKSITIVAFTDLQRENVPIGIIVQCRGKAYHAQEGIIKREGFITSLPADKFAQGINQVTLFDETGKPVAERLIYINHNESLSLQVKVDSAVAVYKKRQWVTVYADAAYPNGKPAYGNFAFAVYDDDRVPNKIEYPLTITNYLSLTSDLKGYIENPGYYFKDALPETKKHLDLLMLVNGWRRYTWQDVLAYHEGDKPLYQHEKGLPISGRVMKAMGKKALSGSSVKIMTMGGNVVIVKPDSVGRFYTEELSFFDSLNLVVQTENEKGKKQPSKFTLNPPAPAASAYHVMGNFTPFVAPEYTQQQVEKNKIDKSIQAVMLKEVEIEAKKIDPVIQDRLIGYPSARTLNVRELGKGYSNVYDMLQSRVGGVRIEGDPNSFRNPAYIIIRRQAAALAINGLPVDNEVIRTLQPSDIELVEVYTMGSGPVFGNRPTINFVLKSNFGSHEPIGITQVKYAGFYMAREFYSPRYNVPDIRHSAADKRTTLYWEPMVETDSLGRAAVSFYTADSNSRYRIVVEGITPDGCAGTATLTFDVNQ